ncbi:RNA polymerase sigma factor [Nocardioides sp. SLBN-35]|uniref:RNA polymerase sigma factor n=1 Tax=Nocardioides sp. SLBN-35 TaxID=2768445 RepID=UPI00115383A8|nr:sigma factor-like helix-turn-helix DNA-binding protein [Nocardioides sp. SLBN-35]
MLHREQDPHPTTAGAMPDAGDRQASDEELLRRFRAGDDAAFEALYRRHLPTATAIAATTGCHRTRGEDAAAEAFAKIFRAMRRGHGPTENFCGYLATAVRRLCYETMRHDARHLLVDDWAVLEPVEVEAPPPLTESHVGAALAALPAPWRELLWWIEVDGHPTAAIAAAQGRTPGAVSAAASRARRRLRNSLSSPAA